MQTVVGGVQSTRARRTRTPYRVRRSFLALALMVFTCGLVFSVSESAALAGLSNNLYLVAGSGSLPNPPGSTGTSSTLVGFASPSGVAADASGNLLVADTSNGEVDLVVRASTALYSVSDVASPINGDTYVLAGGGSSPPSTSGTPATSVGGLVPSAVAQDSSGNVLIADTYYSEIDVVAESAHNPGYAITGTWTVGDIYLIAGGRASPPTVGGGVATSVVLNQPRGMAIDSTGDIIIADTSDNEIDLLSLVGTGSRTAGDLYVIAGGGTGGAPTASGLTATTAQLNQPKGVAIDAHGNIAVADSSHNAVDILALSAADPGYGIGSSWSTGNVYRILGGGASTPTTGGVASALANLKAPQGVAFDTSGDLVVADVNNKAVEVLALASDNPGYALGSSVTWAAGDLYVIAGGGLNNLSTSGTVANQSLLYAPTGVTVLPDGSLSLIDHGSYLLDRLILSPSMPRSLSATALDATVTLNWSAPASSGGSDITDYAVYVYDHGQSLPIATDDLGSIATSLTVSGLSNGVAYDFAVVAQNAIGTSFNSVKVASTPVAPVPPPVVTTTTVAQTTTTMSPLAVTTTTSTSVTTTPVTVVSVPPVTSEVVVSGTRAVPASVVRPRISMLSAPIGTSANDLSFAIRCSTSICRGALTVTDRHLVQLRERVGSISVFEESVVARVFYRDSSTGVRVIHVPLTSYGRGMIRLLSSRGASVVATATTRGGGLMRRQFRVFSYKTRAKKT